MTLWVPVPYRPAALIEAM